MKRNSCGKKRFTSVFALMTVVSLAASLAASAESARRQNDPALLDFDASDVVYRAGADLAGHGLPIVGVSNPSSERFVTVEVLARAGSGSSRIYRLTLEPGGSSDLGLGAGFAQVSLISKDPFVGELLGARAGASRQLTVSEGPYATAERSQLAKAGEEFCLPECFGDWTLTCQNCSFGPYTEEGRVECSSLYGTANRVYWNQNVPTGAWTTIGDQDITATWGELEYGCPTEVTNSLGHTYTVEID